jgi:transcriptional regulator GlxA family with amidase domain
LRVGIVLTAKFTLSALANFVDVLRLAGDEGDGSRQIGCRWHIMSAAKKPIAASCGFEVSPTSGLIDPHELHYIAVIGGLLYRGPPIDSVLAEYLLRAGSSATGLLGICTGSFVLCRLGLMKGRKCCVSWYHYQDFLSEFSHMTAVADELYVTDGSRITCSGGIGSALVAAHLVGLHLTPYQAQKALHIMQIDNTAPGSQLQPLPPLMPRCSDENVARALLLMEQNVREPLSAAQLAGRLDVSVRTLERLFRKAAGLTPHMAYLKLRLACAHRMLRSRQTLAFIAVETGFSRGSQFGAAYKRVYGVTPSEVRRRQSQDFPPARALPYGERGEARVFRMD